MLYFLIYILMPAIKFDRKKGSNVSCSSFQLLEIDLPFARFESWERKNIARRKRRSHERKWSNSDGFPERDRSGRPNRFNTPTTVSIIRPRKTTIASFSFRGVVHRLFRRAIIFGTSLDRWQEEDGERGGGRGRYPCEFTEANILCYLHEKSANIHAAGEQNSAVFGRPHRSRYLCINPCTRIRMMYFVAAMFATTTTSSDAFQKSCATCLPNVL